MGEYEGGRFTPFFLCSCTHRLNGSTTNRLKMHRRKSIRLIEYDSSQPGEYFVTICTHDHECISGEIIQGDMNLSPEVKRAQLCREEMPKHFSNTQLDENKNKSAPQSGATFSGLRLLNHILGIIVIKDESSNLPVGTHNCASLQRKPRSLGSPIAGFKSAATKRINKMRHIPSFPI